MNNTTFLAMFALGAIVLTSASLNDAYGAAFVKYDGIDGESKDANHDTWIDVLNVDWGVTRSDEKRDLQLVPFH